MQVTRVNPIPNTPQGASTRDINAFFQQLLQGTVWQYYQLVITQWPSNPHGSIFILDADTLELQNWRQLLPYQNDKTWIPTVDSHSIPADPTLNPHMTNELANAIPNENFSGVFNTPALYPGSDDSPQTISPRLFIGMGGPNYHSASPGIDYESTPFMRAVDAATLEDAWSVDDNDPPRYQNAMPPCTPTPARAA